MAHRLRSVSRRHAGPASALATLFLLASGGLLPLGAQQLRLLVQDDQSRAPIGGAIVRLLDGRRVVTQALTGENGRVTLDAPAGPSYSIRIDRIGYEGTTLPGVELPATGFISREFLIPSIRRTLPTVMVEGETRCNTLETGGVPVVALWEEVRKALEATVITRQAGETPLFIRNFRRETDLDGVGRRQWYTSAAVRRGVPFTAPPPAELIEHGFMLVADNRATLHGPDAELLLNDGFVATHCYRAVAGDSGQVGLVFTPTPDRMLPDIQGILWVDRATSELRSLEFSYTQVPDVLKAPLTGGRLEFSRLPDGGWIIHNWYIRAPRPGMDRERDGPGYVGYLDIGGLAEVSTAEADAPTWSRLVGLVFDSLAGTGLPDALVTVVATGDSLVTDAEGRFELPVRGSGDQVVSVTHPRLGLLGEATGQTALFSIGETTTVEFGVPSLEQFVASLCRSARRNAAIVGMVIDPDGRPLTELAIESWTGALGGQTVSRSARVAANGLFAICNLPAGQARTVRVYRGSSPLAEEVVRLQVGEHRWIDLRLP